MRMFQTIKKNTLSVCDTAYLLSMYIDTGAKFFNDNLKGKIEQVVYGMSGASSPSPSSSSL